MPRKYQTDSRGKRYVKRNHDDLKPAIAEIFKGRSIRKVAEMFKIPYSVLYRHFKKRDSIKSQGGQTAMSKEEENLIVENLKVLAEWGYPMDCLTLRLFVKGYLDRRGKIVRKFKDNTPGMEFVYGFLKRHKDQLAVRMCQNIKRSRAVVSRSVLRNYFDNLQNELLGVPPSNIINYDETNLSDDPGRSKVITKRGCKYPERVLNSSKSSTSIMFAASADGNLLPVYVVYKAKHLYNSWIENGPPKARYNRSLSGWFDSECFDDWVQKVVLPYCKKLNGVKYLIGDNLSSHLSVDSIRLCRQENIKFIFLPSNSTHLTQPLDVSFFHPLKQKWRTILKDWKMGPGKKETTVPKDKFPRLLKTLIDQIFENVEENIKSGFRKCGIIPFDPQKVLERVPEATTENEDNNTSSVMNSALVSLLEELRYSDTPSTRPKKNRINVEAGKSVALDTTREESDSDQADEPEPISASDGNSSESESVTSSNNTSFNNLDEGAGTSKQMDENDSYYPAFNVKQGDFLIAKFPTNKRTRRYIANVSEVKDDKITVKCLRKKIGKKLISFVYPDIEDICEIKPSQIERKIAPLNIKRGLHSFAVNPTHLE